jgi:hypothetical protein
MTSKFMRGSSLLMGDNTVPGLTIPDDLKLNNLLLFDIYKHGFNFERKSVQKNNFRVFSKQI